MIKIISRFVVMVSFILFCFFNLNLKAKFISMNRAKIILINF